MDSQRESKSRSLGTASKSVKSSSTSSLQRTSADKHRSVPLQESVRSNQHHVDARVPRGVVDAKRASDSAAPSQIFPRDLPLQADEVKINETVLSCTNSRIVR